MGLRAEGVRLSVRAALAPDIMAYVLAPTRMSVEYEYRHALAARAVRSRASALAWVGGGGEKI